MITHIVLFQCKPSTTEETIAAAVNKLGNLRHNSLKQIKSFTHGKNSSPENLNRGYNYGFTMTFASASDRDQYLTHPDHIEIAKNDILPLLINGVDSALAFDYES